MCTIEEDKDILFWYLKWCCRISDQCKLIHDIIGTTSKFIWSSLIGINYQGTPDELGGCANDVMNQLALITDPAAPFKVPKENILIFLDGTHIKPTRENLLAGLAWSLTDAPAVDFGDARRPGQPL